MGRLAPMSGGSKEDGPPPLPMRAKIIPGFGPVERDNALKLIELALAEDLGSLGDLTSKATIPEEARGAARFAARGAGVIAGLPVVGLLADRFGLAEGWRPT